MLSSPAAVSEEPVAANPSPKRKRSDSNDPATTAALSTFAPRLNTNISTIAQSTGLSSASAPMPGSPRSLMAARLSDLQIKELKENLPILEFGVTDEPTKRIKRAVECDEIKSSSATQFTEKRDVASYEELSKRNGCGMPSMIDSSGIHRVFETNQVLTSGSLSSLRKSSSPPPPLSDLVWRDSEITGHMMADPDDDGTGINGIGFRPTPAIQYAREQRRKQQINDWRLREAREARQKRSERRRGMAASDEKKAVEGAIRRMVRFGDALKG